MGHDIRRGRCLALCRGRAGIMLAGAARAQRPSIRVYSEFQRIDPFGRGCARGPAAPGRHRAARNPLARVGAERAASYHVAVTVPPGTPYSLYLGQNPEGFLGVTMYKEIHVLRGAQWVPDGLERVRLFRMTARLPDAARPIPGQTTVIFLMEVWTPPTPLWSGGRSSAASRRRQLDHLPDGGSHTCRRRPHLPETRADGAPPASPIAADLTARAALRAYLCSSAPGNRRRSRNVRGLIARDVPQDIALARSIEKSRARSLLPEILKLAGVADSAKWCQAARVSRGSGTRMVPQAPGRAEPHGKLALRIPDRSRAGEMAEWLKAHAWKACIGETLSRVRIPLSPPNKSIAGSAPRASLSKA